MNINEEWIKDWDLDEESRADVLGAMSMYRDDNRWWMGTDLRRIAFFQVNQPILLVEFQTFMDGLSLLLGRKVDEHELHYGVTNLKREVSNAWMKHLSKL